MTNRDNYNNFTTFVELFCKINYFSLRLDMTL